MLYEAKQIKLKNGITAVFRSGREEDAEALLDYLKVTASETPYLLRAPEECTQTVADEVKWINNMLASEYDTMIICEIDGKIAGNCQVSFKRHMKSKHRGTIGIALRKEYWNLGIGTAMFEEMIRIANERGGITQLELEFIEGNERARYLYEKMGFQIVAAKPNAIRLPDGTMLKEFIMVREL